MNRNPAINLHHIGLHHEHISDRNTDAGWLEIHVLGSIDRNLAHQHNGESTLARRQKQIALLIIHIRIFVGLVKLHLFPLVLIHKINEIIHFLFVTFASLLHNEVNEPMAELHLSGNQLQLPIRYHFTQQLVHRISRNLTFIGLYNGWIPIQLYWRWRLIVLNHWASFINQCPRVISSRIDPTNIFL